MFNIILAFLLFLTGTIAEEIETIKVLIGAGDGKSLVQHLDRNVELGINDKQGLYSNANAKVALDKFFEENPAERFEIIHKSEVGEDARNCIGKYFSENGKEFRATFYISKSRGKYLIQEIYFNESGDASSN